MSATDDGGRFRELADFCRQTNELGARVYIHTTVTVGSREDNYMARFLLIFTPDGTYRFARRQRRRFGRWGHSLALEAPSLADVEAEIRQETEKVRRQR